MNTSNQDMPERRDITAERTGAARGAFDVAGHVAGFLSRFSPRTVAYVAIAVVAALVVQSAVVTTLLVKDQGADDFGLASAASGEPPLLVVRFSPDATVSGINTFLIGHKAEVVSGPRIGNFYDIRIKNAQASTDMVAVVKDMQREPTIVDLVAVKE